MTADFGDSELMERLRQLKPGGVEWGGEGVGGVVGVRGLGNM